MIRYKSDKALQKGLQEMLQQGWSVDQRASRKAFYSATARRVHLQADPHGHLQAGRRAASAAAA